MQCKICGAKYERMTDFIGEPLPVCGKLLCMALYLKWRREKRERRAGCKREKVVKLKTVRCLDCGFDVPYGNPCPSCGLGRDAV